MEELTHEEWLKKYPYMRILAKFTIFTTKNDIDYLKNSEKININNEEIPIELLKRILTNDLYFEYAIKLFNNEIPSFKVTYIINGDTGPSLQYKKITIFKGIEQLVNTKQINLQEDELKKYESLKAIISFDNFLKKYKEHNYTIDIEGEYYTIPIEQLISFMQLPDEEFNNICYSNEINTIYGIKKEYFVYAALYFYKVNNIIENYDMPDNIIKHYSEIESNQILDIQAINEHLTTKDTKYKEIHINEELEQLIIRDMPNNITKLEKAIYIYIKMCKLLTYDDEYFAVNQSGEATLKHRNTNYISTITPSNNKVVCFEFNLIYSKLLNDLGLNFSSDYQEGNEKNYGIGHANLEFRFEKYLIKADSVTSILQGDIMQAKLNQPLFGITCINKNLQTKQEFKETLTKIYQLIAKQEKSIDNQPVEHIQTLEELLNEYSQHTDNIKTINLNEKFSILINKVNSTKMVGIDALSYIIQLRKILFNEEQRENNIKISIIRNNKPFSQDRIAMTSLIFTLNSQSFTNNPDQNIYFYYNPNQELIPISLEDLQEKFNDGTLEYIEYDDPRIPGIIEPGGIKNDK